MLEVLIMCAVVGLLAWAIVELVPMPRPIRTVIIVVAILMILLYVLRTMGGAFPDL